MKRIFLTFLLCGSLFGATEPINVNTGDGFVKQTSSGVGTVAKPFDFSNVSVAGIETGNGGSQLISGGGVAWTGTGFNYIISAATYVINSTQYSSPQTPVTLDPADATEDRIDVFYVDISGTAGVITGTPGTPPIAPSVDPASQLELTFAYVVAASTTPVITNENIYLENTEYTMSASAGTINVASTNNPYAGTKDIEGTATVNGNFFTATKPSGTLDLSGYTQLTFQLRSKAAWPNAKSISVFWLNGTTVIGAPQAVKNGTFGFDSSNTTTYQQIVIPISNFGTGTNAVNKLRMTVSGGGAAIGWYIDNIILQAGGGGGGGGGTVTNFSAGLLSPLFTTSVTNPTTTPALSFTLSTAAAHNYFGNNTGSTAAPAFHQIAYSEITGTPAPITPAALTKTDDTNVTLTLGGTPATALLQATSLTLGWTGTLSIARGGWGKAMTDPNADRLTIWDDTDGDFQFVTVGTGLTYTHATHTLSSSSGAPADAHYLTTQAETGLSNEFSLGSLTTGLLKHTVSGSVSTPATATAGTDYADLAFKTFAVSGQSDVVADSAADTLTLAAGTNITLTTNASTDTITITAAGGTASHAVTFVVDGSGSVVSTGTKNPVKIPFGGTLTGWLLIASPSGSVTVDILRAADGVGLPVTSIVGGSGTKPALSSAVENSSTSFTSWTSTTLTAKDNMAISLSGVTSVTYCALTLYYQ